MGGARGERHWRGPGAGVLLPDARTDGWMDGRQAGGLSCGGGSFSLQENACLWFEATPRVAIC